MAKPGTPINVIEAFAQRVCQKTFLSLSWPPHCEFVERVFVSRTRSWMRDLACARKTASCHCAPGALEFAPNPQGNQGFRLVERFSCHFPARPLALVGLHERGESHC